MDGWPVWLASLSIRDRSGQIVPTAKWDEARMERAQRSLDTLLDGIGDPARQRSFRMCVTLCRHRALTPEEADYLPEEWWTVPARDLAGGPIEVLWSSGIPDTPSTQPCAAPIKLPFPGRIGLYLPGDCGECESCVARRTCRTKLPVRPS